MSELVKNTSQQSDTLGDALRKWNNRLKQIPGSEPLPYDDRISLQQELDDLCEFKGEQCAFLGYGQIVKTENPTIQRVEEDYIDLAVGVSAGFDAAKFGKEGMQYWAVGWYFMHDDMEIPRFGSSEATDLKPQAYYLNTLARYAIVPTFDIDEANTEELEFPTVQSTLTDWSDLLVTALDSQEFLSLPATKQLAWLDTYVADAKRACLKVSRQALERSFSIEATLAYVLGTINQAPAYRKINIYEEFMMSEYLDITTLLHRQLTLGRQITSAQQLIDLKAGLCVVAHISKEKSIELGLLPNEDVYIPISNQHVELLYITQGTDND